MADKKDSPKEEFKEVIYESCKAIGLEDFPSRLLSVLQSEPEEISLGELSEMTGYSLSGLSTTLKGMEERQMVKRFKKPKSRKVYVKAEEDITTFFIALQKKRYEQSIRPSLEKIPRIIGKYEKIGGFEEELGMIKDYYTQILFLAEETRKFIEALEKGRKG
ncbi:DNA-binding transcriptional regulator GbsR (MarR family) [Methanobacterium oryzae]